MTRVLSPAVRAHADRLFRYHDVSETPPAPVDLIVGLGSYQPAVADHCARLYHDGLAPFVVFTGGFGNWTRGVLAQTEAEMFRDRALAAGVSEEAILLEPEAANLGENATRTRRLIEARGLQAERVAVVTKRNTTRRARLTFRRAWPGIRTICDGPAMAWSEQAVDPLAPEDVVDEMVGDIQRILLYPKLGHQAPDDIPDDVLVSYRALVGAGFDRHLIAGQPIMPAEPAVRTTP